MGRVFLFAVSVGAAYFTIPAAHAAILFNEISYNPPGTDANHEWVEIVNTGPSAVDLTAWKFYQAGNHSLSAFQGDLTLPANGYAVLTGSGSVFMEDHPGFAGVVVKTSFSLLNSGEEIRMVDGNGATADSVTYATSFANGDGFTLERNAAGQWVQSLDTGGTPGEENSIIPPVPEPSPSPTPSAAPSPAPSLLPVSPGDVLFNEFLATPATGQSEWIELYNFSGHAIDLSLLTIEDATGTAHPLSGTLPSDSYAVLDPSPVSLNNAGDTLILRRLSDGVPIDQVSYGSAGSGSVLSSAGQSIGAYPDTSLTGSGRTLHTFSSATRGAFNTVDNHAPVAVITIQSPFDTSGPAPFSLNVTGESSTDPDGDVLSFRWEYGDGETTINPNPLTKNYAAAGTFTLRLTVTDPWGASSIATQSITVTPPSTGGSAGGGSVLSTIISTPTCSSRLFAAQVTLNEVLPNPTGSDATGEFIELYNGEPLPVNVCGWSLDDGAGGSPAYTFTTDTFIPARGYRAFFIPVTGITLNNDQDAARLLNPEGKEVSGIQYAASSEGRSFSRFTEAGKDVWKWTTATPDGENALPPQVDGEDLQSSFTTGIRISEILPDPAGLDREGEFIELENAGETVDLKGFQLRVGKGRFTFTEDTSLVAGAFLSLPYAQTRLALTNAGGIVELLDPRGQVVDRVEYGQAPAGHAFALFASDWGWTTPTPGEANRDEPPVGGPDLQASSDFSVKLKQGKQLLYLQGQTLPDADVHLQLFLLDAAGEAVYDEADLELTAHSSMKRGSFSAAMQVALDLGTYRVVSVVRPRGQESFTDDTHTVSIASDAIQAQPKALKAKKKAAKKKITSKAKTVSSRIAKANAGITSGELLDEPYIGGTTAEDAREQRSNVKGYVYGGLLLFTLAGLGTIVLGKKK